MFYCDFYYNFFIIIINIIYIIITITFNILEKNIKNLIIKDKCAIFWYYICITTIISYIIPFYYIIIFLFQINKNMIYTKKFFIICNIILNIYSIVNFINIDCMNSSFIIGIFYFQFIHFNIHIYYIIYKKYKYINEEENLNQNIYYDTNYLIIQ